MSDDSVPFLEKLLARPRTLALLVLGAIGLRLAAAGLRGDYLGFDESMYVILGRNLLSGRGYTLNGLPNATFPFLISLLAGMCDALAGPRLALSLPSAVLGGAAVIPLYLLVSRIASRRVAIATAILYAGYPALLFFSPFVSYARRLYEGSEQIYLFLVLTAAYFAYRAVLDGRWRDCILGGLFAGAAFEVRQDAAVWAAAVFAWMFAAAIAQRRWTNAVKSVVFAAAAFAAALPFLVHVRQVTGAYGAGPRFAKTFSMRDTFVPVIEENDWTSALASYFALNKDGTGFESSYYGVSPWHRQTQGGGDSVEIRRVMGDLRPAYAAEALRLFVEKAVPDKLLIALLLGIGALLLSERRWLNMTFLLVQAIPAAFIAMSLFPLARFSMYMAPYAVMLVAWGIVLVFDVIGRCARRASPWAAPAAFIAVAAAAAYGAYDAIGAQVRYRDDRKNFERVMEGLQKQAAQWLSENTAPGTLVMADAPQAAVLSGRQWLLLPVAGEKRTVSYIRDRAPAVVIKITQLRSEWLSSLEANLATVFSAYSRSTRVSLVIYDLRGGVKPVSGKLPGEGNFGKFILITLDTLRADHLGCYGYDLPASPSIDHFAGESLRFANAFAASSFTGPSVTSMLTSRYPGLTESNFANGYPVDPIPAATLAKSFNEEGYRTAAFVGNYVLRPAAGLAEGFRVYDTAFDSAEVNRGTLERVASSLTPAAESWLAAHSNEPFFLWLHYQDPHGPYTPPAPYNERFVRRTASPTVLDVVKNVTGYRGIPGYQVLGGNRDLAYYVSQYDGEIAFVDEWIGRLLDKVRSLGIWDTTVIALAADHGEAFGEHEYYCAHGHGVGPELTRVPLLLRIPGRPGAVSGVPVSLVDIAPTMLGLAGFEIPRTFQGENLLDTLETGKRQGVFFSETSYAIAAFEGTYCYTWGRIAPSTSRPQNMKAESPEVIDFEGAPTALYDVVSDPAWAADIHDRRNETAGRLKARCEEHIRKSVNFCGKVRDVQLDEETRRKLDALGYTDR